VGKRGVLCAVKCIQQGAITFFTFEGAAVKELASSKQLTVDFGQLSILADRLPILRSGYQLMLDVLGRICFCQMVIWCHDEAGRE
jgi:hypothetical protein